MCIPLVPCRIDLPYPSELKIHCGQLCVGGGVVKVSSIGIGRKGVRFKRAFIMLRHAKQKMSHIVSLCCLLGGCENAFVLTIANGE